MLSLMKTGIDVSCQTQAQLYELTKKLCQSKRHFTGHIRIKTGYVYRIPYTSERLCKNALMVINPHDLVFEVQVLHSLKS